MLVTAAVMAGIGAFAAVYVFLGASRNPADPQCRPTLDLARRIAPLAHGEVAAVTVAEEARKLPALVFRDAGGTARSLADWQGRTVLFNLWATWCVPCRKEMPALDRVQAQLGDRHFHIVPLSIDREGVAPVKRFYQEVGVEKLSIYVDPSGRGSHSLAISGVPTTLLIDPEGREVARKMGAAEWDSPEMASLIERTMHGRSASNGGYDR
jgi:thiol-disulfide isomerase/thioredoxin